RLDGQFLGLPDLLHTRPRFTDLASLRQSCAGPLLWGHAGFDFADDQRATQLQDMITAAIRDSAVMWQVIQTCTPLAMKLLLLFLEQVLKAPGEADLQEAKEAHVAFNTLKVWLLQDVLPKEDPEAVLKGWDLHLTEARVFNHYKNLWRAVYTRNAAERDGQENAPDFVAMALDQNRKGEQSRSKSFYQLCPAAQASQHVNVLEAGRWGQLVEGPVPSKMRLIGNSLSLYWQARALSELLGASFLSSTGQEMAGRFTDFLPRATQGKAPWGNASTELELLCGACPNDQDWRWPHSCVGVWIHPILPMVKVDTQRALHASGAEGAVATFLRKHDAVIHFRCFPFFGGQYPLAAFSLYAALPPSLAVQDDLRFIIVAGPLGQPCAAAARALAAFLQKRFPQASVVEKFNGSAPEGLLSEDLSGDGAEEEFDFALQVYAPVLIRSPSSFSLWAALARSEDQLVISSWNPPVRGDWGWRWPSANFGRNWRWVEVPLLTEDVVAEHGFEFQEYSAWVKWLEMH
ncbi:Uncharacterized protein SCF082_LOCUS41281, partial [Durusdinium trenchii]